MTRKGAKGQKLYKGQSLYTHKLDDRVAVIIAEILPIKTDGSLHYSKLAKVMGIPAKTFNSWKNPEGPYYKPEFTKALKTAHEELLEDLASGRIKQAMIIRAQPYKRVKKTKELKVRGPKMPAMGSMDKKALILIARKLGLKINKKSTKGLIRIAIEEEIEKRTKETLVTTKQEEEQMHGDVAAARLVLPNIGPKDKRWMEKAEVEVTGKSLADIAAIMSEKKKR